MGLETGTYISDLVATNPVGSDGKDKGDDHIRLLKSTIKATFPNISGAVTSSHAELNILDGVTSTAAELNILDGVTASAAELNILDGATITASDLNTIPGLAPKASPALTGVPTAPTAAPGTNTTQIATMAALQQAAFQSALPTQAGHAGEFLTTDGTDASWAGAPGQVLVLSKTGTYTAQVADRSYLIECSGTFTVNLTSASTLTHGWFCYVKNAGTGIITIDPDGSELIDGGASIKVYPGESLVVACTGTAFKTIGRQRFVAISAATISTEVTAVDFEAGFDDAEFDSIKIVGHGVTVRDDATPIYIRTKHGGSYSTSNYAFAGYAGAPAIESNGRAAAPFYTLAPSVDADEKVEISIECKNPGTSATAGHLISFDVSKNTGQHYRAGHGVNTAGAAVQGARLITAGGSFAFTAGTFYVYGTRK